MQVCHTGMNIEFSILSLAVSLSSCISPSVCSNLSISESHRGNVQKISACLSVMGKGLTVALSKVSVQPLISTFPDGSSLDVDREERKELVANFSVITAGTFTHGNSNTHIHNAVQLESHKTW